jgi:hypothetical protein
MEIVCCWNYSRNEGGGDKEEWWREWIQLWYILRTLVKIAMYPQYNNNKKKNVEKSNLYMNIL